MSRMLAVRLPEEIDKKLTRAAKKTNQTKTAFARQAILEYIDDVEDYFLAISRLEENLKSIPLDAVEKKIGLEG